jgi:hypothetical protein
MKKDSIKQFELPKEGLSSLERVRVGDWFWVRFDDEEWDDEQEKEVKTGEHEELMCVEHIGSNYVGVSHLSEYGSHDERIHFDEFEARCREEPKWKEHLNEKMEKIQLEMKDIMAKMIEEGRGLYLIPQETQGQEDEEPDCLLPAKVTVSPKKHQKELIAFQKRMPEMQKEIEDLAKDFAVTAKQLALPDLVQLDKVKKALGVVEDRIFTLELYCGLQETVKQIADGEPAKIDEPVRIMQQLLYMDEECLFDYDDGGMDFEKLSEFDDWVVKPENLNRLAHYPRCIVGFRVRRYKKDRGPCATLGEAWIRMRMDEADMETYLLIRNGQKVYRIASPVDFSPRLIPKRDELGEEQFKKIDSWNRDKEPEKIGPDHIEYDDHVEKLDDAIKHYNRVIILLQGMFDRSKIFWPHVGVKLTRDDHMNEWVKCIRDEEDGLPNNSVTWDAYRDQVNKTIRKGKRVWSKWRPDNIGRYSFGSDRTHYSQSEYEIIQRPRVCEVTSIRKDKSEVRISFEVEKYVYGRRDKWGDWVEGHDKKITRHLWVPMKEVFNVSDYNMGDYKMFLCDRALQGSYLKWASQLLHAEDEARKNQGRDVSLKSKKKGWRKERCVGHDGEEFIMESTGGTTPLGEGL